MKTLSLLFPFAAAAPPNPPTPPTPPSPPAATAPTTSSWSYKSGDSDVQIQTTGNVTFDVASDAVFDLHGSGTLRVSERDSKDSRVLAAQGNQVTWQVNGADRPYDTTAKDWLRRILNARPATPTPPRPPTPPTPPTR